MFLPVQDGVANLISKIGSDIDPTIHQITANCPQDLLNWFAGGGITKKIASFWAFQMGTGIEITILNHGKRQKSADTLIQWIQSEFDRLDVTQILIEAELQCAVSNAAPIVVITDGIDSVGASPTNYSRVEMLQIQDPTFFHPQGGMLLSRGGLDLRTVTRYMALRSPGVTVHSQRVLPLQGQKLLSVEQPQNQLERYWGRPRIGTNILLASVAYDVVCKYAEILIQKKNFLSYGITGFNRGMSGANAESYASDCLKTLKLLQKTAGLLGVEIHDIGDSLTTIDRNITGINLLITEIRNKLLAECPGIPETYLFGRQTRGGLASDNREMDQVDSEANRLFNQRWLPLLRQLVMIMIKGDCPSKTWDIQSILISRSSGFRIDPLDVAQTNLIVAQTKQLELLMPVEDV